MTGYSITGSMEGTVATVRVDGEFDFSAVDEFRATSKSLLATDDLEAVVVDLRPLEFLDSSGLAEIVRLENRSRAGGFRLAILRPPPPVERIFEITGLDQHLPLYDAETALDSEPNRG